MKTPAQLFKRHQNIVAMVDGATTPSERSAAENALRKHVEKHGDPTVSRYTPKKAEPSKTGPDVRSGAQWHTSKKVDPLKTGPDVRSEAQRQADAFRQSVRAANTHGRSAYGQSRPGRRSYEGAGPNDTWQRVLREQERAQREKELRKQKAQAKREQKRKEAQDARHWAAQHGASYTHVPDPFESAKKKLRAREERLRALEEEIKRRSKVLEAEVKRRSDALEAEVRRREVEIGLRARALEEAMKERRRGEEQREGASSDSDDEPKADFTKLSQDLDAALLEVSRDPMKAFESRSEFFICSMILLFGFVRFIYRLLVAVYLFLSRY